jgi:hypothetical protein
VALQPQLKLEQVPGTLVCYLPIKQLLAGEAIMASVAVQEMEVRNPAPLVFRASLYFQTQKASISAPNSQMNQSSVGVITIKVKWEITPK